MPSEAKTTTSPGSKSMVVSSYWVSGMSPRNEPEGHAFQADGLHLAFADQEGIRTAGVGKREFPSRGVVNGKQHGDESRIKTRAEQPLIQKGEHASRLASVIDDDFSNGADRQGAVQCRRSAFARNIAERKTKTADAVRKKVVEISPQGPRWNVSSREIEARHFPGAGRQKLALDFPRGIEIVPKLPFVLPGLFIAAARPARNELPRRYRSECNANRS